jgi:hypothetical protein
MKTLALPSEPVSATREERKQRYAEQLATIKNLSKSPLEPKAESKPKTAWLEEATSRENLTDKEAIIRGFFIVTMPILSAVAWYYDTYFILLLVPVLFYLEITAFTLYCPIKALFSNYRRPIKIE